MDLASSDIGITQLWSPDSTTNYTFPAVVGSAATSSSYLVGVSGVQVNENAVVAAGELQTRSR